MALFEIGSDLWLYWISFFGIIMVGYFIAASSLYWLIQPAPPKNSPKSPNKTTQKPPNSSIKNDIKLSIESVILFSLGAALFMHFYNLGCTRVYLDWKLSDLGYIAFSYLLVLTLQDTCFYFLHRLFHLPQIFSWSHQGHHQSRTPTPWTCLALDPVEAISQIGLLLAITFILPLNIGVLVAILITMTVWSMGNHLGLRVVPLSRSSRWWGQWFIGSTHHLVHHQRHRFHYGLYFTFWDKLLGTQDPRYESQRRQTLSPS